MSACWRPTSSRGSRRPDRPRRSATRTGTSTPTDGALEAAGYSRSPPFDGQGRPSSRSRAWRATTTAARRTGARSWKARPIPRSHRRAWPASAARDAVVADRRRARRCVTSSRSARSAASGTTRVNGTVVEVSVDDVEVLVGAQVAERFAELELELREGDEADLEPLADLLGEIEELVPVETRSSSGRSRSCGREPREPEPDEVDSRARPRAGEARDPPRRPVRRAAAPTAQVGPGDDAGRGGRRRGGSPAVLEAVPDVTPDPSPSRRGSWSPSRPACSPTTTSPRRGARSCGSTSPGWSPARPGPATGKDAEDLHAMRVATRRQRAAWRVFGDAFDAKRTARHRKRLRFVAADLGAGPRPRRPDRVDRGLRRASSPRRRRPRSSRSIRSWRIRRDAARAVLVRRARQRALPALARRVPGVRPGRGPGRATRRPDRAAPGARHDAVPGLGRLRGRARVRAGHALGGRHRRSTTCGSPPSGCATRSSSCARRSGRDAGPVIERIVALQDHLGWLHDADVAAGLARAFLVEHAGDLTEVESAAIGRYLVDREREPRASCAGPSARRGAACRASPTGARSGGSSPDSDRSAPRQHLDAVLAVVQDDQRAVRRVLPDDRTALDRVVEQPFRCPLATRRPLEVLETPAAIRVRARR